MHGEQSDPHTAGDVATSDVPPMRDLAFSILSLLVDAAAAHMRVEVAGAATPSGSLTRPSESGMREARAAIDAANALLSAVRNVMEMDALRAVESMLTQLQIEYVRQAGRLT
jgi:type VI protein secretion system component VasF